MNARFIPPPPGNSSRLSVPPTRNYTGMGIFPGKKLPPTGASFGKEVGTPKGTSRFPQLAKLIHERENREI
jgi:hypothetical protein